MTVLTQISLVLIGTFLFISAHPGVIFKNGLFLLGYIALVPIFILIKKSSFKLSFLWGFLYGFLCYSLFAFWLFNYSPLLFFSAILFYSVVLSLLFALIKICSKDSPYEMYIMALIWCVYEYVRTLGALGFSYGIIGYSQWKIPAMLSLSSFCGIWGVSLVCLFSSALIASVCVDHKCIKKNFIRYIIPASVLFVTFVGLSIYCLLEKDTESKTVRVMSVQNNTDSNKTGIDVYKKDIRTLASITDAKLNSFEDVDFVLWPETAVVPPIIYYYSNRIDHERFNIIVDTLDLIARRNACFVIGNQHSEKNSDGVFSDYNAALVFDGKTQNIIPPCPDIYKKIRLVPFAEYIPVKFLRKLSLTESEWQAGRNYTVFTKRNLCFCTPICFEDTFGNLCRKFVNNGAECFFDLSNDSWSRSAVSQRQHLAMSVFRSAENHIPSVRSSGNGISCYVTAHGRIAPDMIKEFSKDAAVYSVSVPVNENPSMYTVCGDWLPVCEICILIWLCISRLLKSLLKRKSKSDRINIWQKKKQMLRN